ncbi:hypothetical protein DPMN_089577 [Dreissena polymorpha]|uniref:Uncharacterized protein n=1 Tax=Dreissena polymorpha TaxID=45954 RepID=A0A9D4QY83_DREPO|nr:hypothetical protein DPMN_089577 [Dreissena polymorpha]
MCKEVGEAVVVMNNVWRLKGGVNGGQPQGQDCAVFPAMDAKVMTETRITD